MTHPPNGGTTTNTSFCCCAKYFRRPAAEPPPTQNVIEIQVNGRSHLRVPHRPPPSMPRGGEEGFETARTSRKSDGEKNILAMSELIRMVRIEEGLYVTPRVEQAPPIQLSATTLTSTHRLRRAVFNDDGDITSRTITAECAADRRRFSTASSIAVPALQLPRGDGAIVSRRVFANTPHLIGAVLTFTYATITSVFVAIGNVFAR